MDPGFAQGNPWIAQIHASRITYTMYKLKWLQSTSPTLAACLLRQYTYFNAGDVAFVVRSAYSAYWTLYCLNLNGASDLFMLRRYTCNNKKQRPCFIRRCGFCCKQFLSMIQPILLPKLKWLRSTSPTLAVYIKAVLAYNTLMQAMWLLLLGVLAYPTLLHGAGRPQPF